MDPACNLQKNHDFDLDLEQSAEHRYLVQYRAPLPAIVSWYEFQLAARRTRAKPGRNIDSLTRWNDFLADKISFWKAFVDRWAGSDVPENCYLISYEQLQTDLAGSLVSISEFFWPDAPASRKECEKVIARVGIRAERDIRTFRYYDREQFKRIEKELADRLEQLGLPWTAHETNRKFVAAASPQHRYKIGLVYNWPEEKNSELDLIGRCASVLREHGSSPVILSPMGHELTSDGHPRNGQLTIDSGALDFCIHFHYTVPNTLDTFSYFTNWNPLGYLFRDPITGTPDSPDVNEYRNFCLRSFDCFLSSGAAPLDRFAKALQAHGAEIIASEDPKFYPTAQEMTDLDFPDLQDPGIFYIGLNWERLLGVKRHGSLLTLLDQSDKVSFYGVKTLGGVDVWSGFRNYKGEIPFDSGKTLFREANKLGVSLVLSSDAHALDAVVSTRIYQACAAKTVIISDDNRFVVPCFGDSVLTFPRSADARTKAEHILRHFDWICAHPEEAREKARRAHDIFLRQFTLEAQVRRLIERHASIKEDFAARYLARSQDLMVDVMLFYDDPHWEDRLCEVCSQQGVRVNPLLLIPPDVQWRDVMSKLDELNVHANPVRLRAERERLGSLLIRVLDDHSEGQAIAVHRSPSAWKKNHLSMLARAIEDGAGVAQASTLLIPDESREIRRDYMPCFLDGQHYHNLAVTEDVLRDFESCHYLPSTFLFSRTAIQELGEKILALDRLDHGACLGLVLLTYLSTGQLPARIRKPTNLVNADGPNPYALYDTSLVPHHVEVGALIAAGVGDGFIRHDYRQNRGALLPQLQVLNGRIRHALRSRPMLTALYLTGCRLFLRVLNGCHRLIRRRRQP